MNLETDEQIISGDRSVLNGKELDIYIPSLNLAIEYNGIYYHSENTGRRDKNYHLNKTKECEKKGIRLIHIFDFEWEQKRTKVEYLIKNALGNKDGKKLYGRKLSIHKVSSKTATTFLNKYHLQGSVNASVRYALFDGDEMVSLMTFGKSRFSKHQWELIRYVVKEDYKIIGGSKKLFKHFVKEYNPETITTYSDIRLFTGGMYEGLGFKFMHESKPNYFYFKGADPRTVKLESRNKYQKHKLPKLLDNFDPELTEVQNMFNNGYDRIWDCGNKVWRWDK